MPDSKSLLSIHTDLSEAYAARDRDRYVNALNALYAAAPHSELAEVDAALHTLAPILRESHLGRGLGLPIVACEIAQHATGPGPLLPIFVDRAIEALTGAVAFAKAAADLDMEPPDAEDQSAAADTLAAFTAKGGDPAFVDAWFAANNWTRPVQWLCNRADVRAILPKRDELTAAVEAADGHIRAAGWLPDLLRVLDNEPLLVLHRETGRGFRVTISGIGCNFQLHTLLAVHLIGTGKLPGTPPSEAEASSATDGPVDIGPGKTLRSYFELMDAYGERVWHQLAVPADIPLLDGERILVLDKHGLATMLWGVGRTYPDMASTMAVEDLPDEEAAAWLDRVALPKS